MSVWHRCGVTQLLPDGKVMVTDSKTYDVFSFFDRAWMVDLATAK